jgi:hypothetical protein
MTATQTPGGDYIPAEPGAKKRMSRGRKALIGLLVFGAVGAAAGGGTFATFTASTDNDSGANPFTIDNDMILANTVVDDGTEDNVCRSDDGGSFTELPIVPDTPNAVECEVLFDATDLGNIAEGEAVTTNLILENVSQLDKDGILRYGLVEVDVDGGAPVDMQVCTNTGATAVGNLCDNLAITIQEYAFGGVRGTDDGDQVLEFDDLDPVTTVDNGPLCVFPRDVAAACDSTLAEDQRLQDDLVTPTAGLIHNFTHADAVIDATMENTEVDGNDGLRFFQIRVQLVGDDATCGATIDADTGIGCTNTAGEQTDNARFTIRWVLQETP